MKNLSLLICFLLVSFNLQAQKKEIQNNIPVCATDIEEAKNMQDPSYKTLQQSKDEAYKKAMIQLNKDRAAGLEKSNPPIYTLPLVVHIIHSGAALGTDANPTDASVTSDINTASDRFRHQHTGADTYTNPLYGADTEIEFCLASTDPDGNYTTGIIRHFDTDLALFDFDNGESVTEYLSTLWPIDEYLNVVIVETLTGAAGVYFGLADATFYHSGSFWSGLIAHEIGHHLNLRHTFQDGCPNNDCLSDGDRVCDTPPKASPGFNGATSCTSPNDACDTDDDDTSANNPYRPIADGGVGNQPDMLANYMDYTGSCWDAFTQGQKDRMRNDISTFRMSLVNSDGCNATTAPALDAGISNIEPTSTPCGTTVSTTVTLVNYGSSTLTTADVLLKVDGVTVLTSPWSGSLATGSSLDIVLTDITLTQGNYVLSAETAAPNGGTDGYSNNDISYSSFSVSGSGTLPYMEDFVVYPAPGISIINPDGIPTTWVSTNQADMDCSGNPNQMITINNYSYNAPGQKDYIRLPTFNLSNYTSATLTFDVAYAPYAAANADGLEIEVSSDCGTPIVEFSKVGLTLATNTPPAYVLDNFFPACTEWRTETVNLDAYTGAGFTQVIVDFVNINDYGNRMYIDNINIVGELGDCAPSLLLDEPIASGTHSYAASDYIEATNVITGNGTNVTYSGAAYVDLQDGFTVELGSEFTVNNDDCIITTTAIIEDIKISMGETNEKITLTVFVNEAQNLRLLLSDYTEKTIVKLMEEKWVEAGKHVFEFDNKINDEKHKIILEGKDGILHKKVYTAEAR